MNGEKERDVYSEIYRIVNENMIASGKQLEFREQTFLSTIGEQAQIANLLKWKDCDADSFLENAYYQLLERMPDQYARNRWNKNLSEKREGWRKEILSSVLNSREYMMKNTCYKNNIYGNVEFDKVRLKTRIRNRLVRLGRALPPPLKKIIKKIIGMG